MKLPRMQRTGSSLIETIIVLTVSSAVVMIAIGWIHQSFRLAKIIRNHDRHHQSVMRMSREFRDDAHLATSVTSDFDQVRFEMSDDQTVLYKINGSTVERQRFTPSENQVIARESYSFAERSEITFGANELPQWVSVTIERAQRATKDSSREENASVPSTRPVDLHVRAAVGRLNGRQLTTQTDKTLDESTEPIRVNTEGDQL